MRRPIKIILPALVAAAVAAGCGGGSSSQSSGSAGGGGGGGGGGYGAPASSPKPATSTMSDVARVKTAGGSLGTHLVDGKGRTLYLWEADTGTKSTCSGACAQAWPPLTTSQLPKGMGDVRTAQLSTTTRSDGTKQVTYGGHPLYFYAGDAKPGDTSGQGSDGFGAEWYVVSPAGKAIDKD